MPYEWNDELVASKLTFDEIATQYDEETAINVGIARDPDNLEWTAEMLARALPQCLTHLPACGDDVCSRTTQWSPIPGHRYSG